MTGTTDVTARLDAPIDPLLVPRPYRVIDKVEECPNVVSLHVVPTVGSLPTFLPAQVSMLGAFGVGEAAISISSPTDEDTYHAYTIRRAGPISGALVDTPIGGDITVRGPFGTPWPLDSVETKQLMIIGGGLGIAPLRALIHAAIGHRQRFDRVALLYGAKSPNDLVYRREFDQWKDRDIEVYLTVDRADDGWDGPVGVVPDRLRADSGVELDWPDTTAFVCGPDVMMHYTAAALEWLGVPDERIWLTLERNMQCGNALCGHCQLGPFIACRDGPVANFAEMAPFLRIQDL